MSFKHLKQLALILCLVFIANGYSQEIPNNKIRTLISQLKKDSRGPYYRIKWFCDDGTMRDAKDPCPDEVGGIQHATFKPEVEQLAQEYGLYFADILASLDEAKFWDAQNNMSRIKQYQLNKYLVNVDNGWILERGQFYRGSIQSEDEEAWGVDFYHWLLEKDEVLDKYYFLVRQSLRDIPHSGDDNLAQRVRSESKMIADEYAPFMDIRVKIHSKPEPIDIKLVDDFYAKHQNDLSADIKKLFTKLKASLREFHKPVDFQSLAANAQKVKANNELTSRLKAFLTSSSNNLSDEVLISEISDLLYQIRININEIESSEDKLLILDISNKLEDILIKKANDWNTNTLETLTDKINLLGCATVGTGLVEDWEYQTVDNKLALIGDAEATLQGLNQFLEVSRSLVQWSTAYVKSIYGETVEIYSEFEPKAHGFIDDRVRSTVALPLGDAVGKLGSFISENSAVTNNVFDIPQQSNITGLNPGYAKGKLFVIEGNQNNVEVSRENIYVFQRPPSDLKPVAGILTVSEGNLVSHVQLLARNLGVPNAALSDGNLMSLKKYDGKEIFYAVSDKGTVLMKLSNEMTNQEKDLFTEKVTKRNVITVPTDNIKLEQTTILNLRDVNANDSGKLCGPKAANLGQLKSLFPDHVVEGFVIPFGIFRDHMDNTMPGETVSYWTFLNTTFQNAREMKTSGKPESEIEAYQLKQLAKLREGIMNLDFKESFKEDIKSNFKNVFKKDIGEVPVFLRSDTNMEDLKEFTGAGLNLTLFNVADENKIYEGIKKVWASPYTERSFKWRQQYLLNPENVFPSILVIPSVDVEYSGVMITQGINSGNKEDLTVAISKGAGGAVDGQSAETRLISETDVVLLSPARDPDYNGLPSTGGTSKLYTTFEKPILNESNIKDLRSIAGEIREKMPKAWNNDYKGAYDVELGFKEDKLWLFQIRPFVENSNAKTSEYLNSIAPKIDYSKKINLSTKI
ncbi:PEP/pyruvate-binding domain-containing protein [Aegicerativicinus sediminis]